MMSPWCRHRKYLTLISKCSQASVQVAHTEAPAARFCSCSAENHSLQSDAATSSTSTSSRSSSFHPSHSSILQAPGLWHGFCVSLGRKSQSGRTDASHLFLAGKGGRGDIKRWRWRRWGGWCDERKRKLIERREGKTENGANGGYRRGNARFPNMSFHLLSTVLLMLMCFMFKMSFFTSVWF